MNATHPLIDGQQNLDLFQKVTEFNLYLVRYVDASWLTTIKRSSLVGQLRQTGNADFHLSQYLLTCFSLSDDYDYDFDERVKRVVLANTEDILLTALFVGIILNEQVIRNTVRRNERVALEKCLGAGAYRFAVKKAQFISRAANQQGPSLLIDWNHLPRFREYLQTTGLQVMGKAFVNASGAFKKRFELKLPKHYQAILGQVHNVTLASKDCSGLVLKAYREVDKQWHHLLS